MQREQEGWVVIVTCCGFVGVEDSDLEEVALRSRFYVSGKAKTAKQAL